MFEPAEVARIRQSPSGSPYSREQAFSLWSLLITEIWARLYIEPARTAATPDRPDPVTFSRGNGPPNSLRATVVASSS
jgi:hypothetical protein